MGSKKTRPKFKSISVLFLVLMMWIASAFSVCAATNAEMGVEITVTTDKQEYQPNEKITATVTLKNTNNWAVEDVSLECIIPEGYVAESGSTYTVAKLDGYGGTVTLPVTFVPASGGAPATGDSSNALLWGSLMILAIAGVSALCVVYRKKRAGLLSLCLCAVLVLSALPMTTLNVSAAWDTYSVSATETVKVGGKEAAVKATATFNVPASDDTAVSAPVETAAPSETTTPAPSETTTPAPSETATPAPSETATSAPSETETPAPSETATPAPSETETPAPTADPSTPSEPSESSQEDIVDGYLMEKTGTTTLAGETNTNLVAYSKGIDRTWAMEVGPGQYFEYKVTTETTKDYWLSFKLSSPLNGAYVDVSVNGVKVGDNVLLPTTAHYDDLQDINFGIASLNAGENIIRFERKSNGTILPGQNDVASVRRIILEAFAEDITADSMTFPVNSTTYDGGSNIVEGIDEISLQKGGYVEYNISTGNEGTYRLQIGINNNEVEGATGAVYFDGNVIKEGILFTKTDADTENKYDMGIVKLTKGLNTIKVQRNNDGTASSDDNNVIDVRNIYIERIDEDIISTSVEFPLNNTTTTTGGSWNPNAKNLSLWKNGWFEYTVNTLTEGSYNLSLYMGSVRDDATASVYVNGECVLKDFNIPNTGNKNTAEEINAGLVTLKAGVNTIKMVRNAKAAVNDTVCVSKFTLVREDIAGDTVDFKLNATTVTKSNIVGITSYDVALWPNSWFEYDISTQKEGTYNIYLGAGTTFEGAYVNVYVNDALVIENAAIQCTSADTDVYSNKLGAVSLSKGDNTIKIMRTTTGSTTEYISARGLTLALLVDSYDLTKALNIYESSTNEDMWIAQSGKSAYGSVEIKKYGSADDKFYVLLANYTDKDELIDSKRVLVDLSLMGDGEAKTFSTPAINITDDSYRLTASIVSFDDSELLERQVEIFNPNMVEKNKNVFVNIAADGFETNVLKKSPDGTEEEYRENVRNYVLRYLNNTPTGRLSFNVCYKRSVVDSDVFDSVLYNVKIDEDGNAVKDADGNSIKTKIDKSTSTTILSWYRDVMERGIDVIEMAVETTKECGAEAWLSIRMNDNHYNEDPNFNSMISYERAEELGVNGKRVNLDFTKEPVQNYYLAYIKELCQNYDIDGIELDFLRAAPYMTTVDAAGKAELSSFVKEVREVVNEVAKQKNKTISIAARVYADEAENLNIYGMDAAQWIADGSIDILATGAYYIPTYYKIPIEQWRQSIDAKNTSNNPYLLYASADWAVRCDMTYGSGYMMWITLEQLKGFASSNYQKGADGIYLFNHFSTSDSGSTTYYVDADGNMTKKEILADKLKGLDSIESAEDGLRVYVDTDKYTDHSSVYPKTLKNSNYTVKLNTGRKPEAGYYTIVIGIDSLDGYTENNFKVTVNGEEATQIGDVPKKTGFNWSEKNESQPVARHVSEAAPRVMQFKVDDLSKILDGENTIVITNNSTKAQKVKWLEIHVDSTPSATPTEAAN